MGHQVFDGFALNRFPSSWDGEDKTPSAIRVVRIALNHHLHIILRAIGGIAFDDNGLGPCRWRKRSNHVAKQVIFRLILGMALGPNQTKRHRQTKHVPTDDEQGKANAEKPGIILAFASFLSQGIFLTLLGLITPITGESQNAIFGWRQDRHGLMSPPVYETMDIPVVSFKQATQAPLSDVDRCPAG